MSVHTDCLSKACERLNIPHSLVGGNEHFIQINIDGRRYYFPGPSTPFNDDAVAKVCRDKEFAYILLGETISMAKSMGFVDPAGAPEYAVYSRESSHADIAAKIRAEFGLPVIIKRNSGSQGQNVFLCREADDVPRAVAAIFARETRGYDHVLLAQEYMEPAKEYRVVIFRKEVLLVYEKDAAGATFAGNLSPLHWENARAVHETDPALLERMTRFIEPIYEMLDLEYGGLDVILDTGGKLRLVELNNKPGFRYFARDNGEEPLIEMYEKILRSLRDS